MHSFSTSLLLGSTFLTLVMFSPLAHAENQPTYYIVNGSIETEDPHLPNEDLKKSEPYSPWYNRYSDFASGYTICYPLNMKVDASLAEVRTVFSNAETQIEVYADRLDQGSNTASAYLHDYDQFANNKQDHSIITDRSFASNGFDIHLLKWSRHKLATVPNDKNNYVSIEMTKNNIDAYTILIKSTDPITNEMQLLAGFQVLPKKGVSGIYQHYSPTKHPLNDETTAFQKKFFSEKSPLRWGMYEPNAPEDFDYLTRLEASLDYTFPIVIRYQSLDENFPAASLKNAYDHKKFVELSLQTFHYEQNNQSVLYDILDGRYDDYFNNYAQDVKTFGHPILLRLDNEMNGLWCPYAGYFFSKDSDLFKAVWRHIYDIFTANQVTNVLWVWNPNDESMPRAKWNHFLNYYPGNDYVDIVGMTGYNPGTTVAGETWREFADIYDPLYAKYSRLFDQPLIIGEFSSSSVGGDKPTWMQKMFDQIGKYDRLKVAIWWNHCDFDANGNITHPYRMDNNLAEIETFRQGLAAYPESPAETAETTKSPQNTEKNFPSKVSTKITTTPEKSVKNQKNR